MVCLNLTVVALDFMLPSMVKVKESTAAFEIGFEVLVGFKLCVTFIAADASTSNVVFEVVGVVTVRYNE